MISDSVRPRSISLGTHQVQQGIADGEGEEIVDDVEHYELANLPPDLRFIGGADMQKQGIKHFTRIISSQDTLEAASDRGKRYVSYISMLQRCFESEPQKDSHLLRGKSSLARRRPIRRAPGDEQVKGAEPNLLTEILKPGLRTEHHEHGTGRIGGITKAVHERRSQDALIVPPAWNLFELAVGFARHAQIKVANETDLVVKIAIAEGSEDRFAQAQRERRQIWKDQPDLEFAAVTLQSSAQ